jgi:glycerol-3-phosphate acyltransferase PlsY
MSLVFVLVLPLLAYLFGSIPFGLVLARLFAGVDIRRSGSGNIGATNVRRTAGTGLGVLTLLGDAAKGAAPVAAGAFLVSEGACGRDLYLSVVALCALAGHLYPLYLGFRDGGKGVATWAGAAAVLFPAAAAVALLVFVMMVCFTGRVSVGSMTAAVSLPAAVWEATGSAAITAAAAVAAAVIVARHHENIARLLAGTEPSVFQK